MLSAGDIYVHGFSSQETIETKYGFFLDSVQANRVPRLFLSERINIFESVNMFLAKVCQQFPRQDFSILTASLVPSIYRYTAILCDIRAIAIFSVFA